MVASIGKIITKLNQVPGTRMSCSLGRKGIEKLAKGSPFEDALGFMLRGTKKPRVDMAVKSSEQGFTVAAMTIRDGKEEIGRIAASITGHGTADELVKTRITGLNGALHSRGHQYMSINPNLDDIAISVSNKHGVLSLDEVVANGEAHATIKTKELVDKLEGAGSYDEVIKKANRHLTKVTDMFRKLLSGESTQKAEKVATTVDDKFIKKWDPSKLKEIFSKHKKEMSEVLDETYYKEHSFNSVDDLLNKANEIEHRVKESEWVKYEEFRKTPEGAKEALEKAIRLAKEKGIDVDDIVKG